MKSKAASFSCGLPALLIVITLFQPWPGRAQPGDWESARSAATAYNAFGFHLLAQMRKTLPGSNTFISPVGAGLALAIAQNGAAGQTWEELQKVLQFDPMNEAKANTANVALLKNLARFKSGDAKEKAMQLEIANSLWIQTGFPIKAPFLSTTQETFLAQISGTDFGDPATVPRINAWVSEKTHGTIPAMLASPLDRQKKLIILDAIYFKSDWMFQFDPKQTSDKPFKLADGKQPKYPRMFEKGEFNYYENAQLQAVMLPYSYDVVMYVFLPKSSLDALVKQLTPENWKLWTSKMFDRSGSVELPRMKLENGYTLNGSLAALGIHRAFSPEADFTGISDQGLYISEVVQKTFVEVNEKGTIASAATELVETMGIHDPKKEPPPFKMIVDHPFLVAICDQYTGSVLFLGAIMDPGNVRP